ncbi:MAG: hypothetical protein WC841_04660 [Candidatus Shapirobacteria bacterium]|jgi:hypothetical protein
MTRERSGLYLRFGEEVRSKKGRQLWPERMRFISDQSESFSFGGLQARDLLAVVSCVGETIGLRDDEIQRVEFLFGDHIAVEKEGVFVM